MRRLGASGLTGREPSGARRALLATWASVIVGGLSLVGCRTPLEYDYSDPLPPVDVDDGGRSTLERPDSVAFLARPAGTDLRLATYNVWKNSIFEQASYRDKFARVVRAIDADVWALQEVWEPTAAVEALFDELLPLPDAGRWHAVFAGVQVTVSRYPIVLHHWETTPNCGTKASLDLIDLPDELNADLYLIHPRFAPFEGPEQDAERQCQADQIISWLRRATDPEGAVGLAAGTPIVIAGDLNMVGSLQSLHTLLEGDIADEARFGPDHAPDWDGTGLVDAEPLHNAVGPDTWTWRSDQSKWAPGRLDFILYSDSVMRLEGSFVLNTASLSDSALAEVGLERLDVALYPVHNGIAFDHLPVVADFALPRRFQRAPPQRRP
jgi:endonuclease/exonuclease/phosphatase family metal-dependent hydrolase